MGEICCVEDCEQLVYAKDMCEMHYRRFLRTGQVGSPGPIARERSTCLATDCELDAEAKGYCHGHYQRVLRRGEVGEEPLRRQGRLCSLDDCGYPHWARGLCQTHYKRLMTFGDADEERPIKQATGEGSISHGYRNVAVPPDQRYLVGGYSWVGEHRLVMAVHLGRPLPGVLQSRAGSNRRFRLERPAS